MEDLGKVNSLQLYTFWKNLSFGLLSIVALIAFSIILPYYFSPIVALLAAAVLYTLLYNNKLSHSSNCMLVSYSIFICLLAYSFISITLNILFIWGIIWLPPEFTFFSKPYLPTLMLCPICFITMVVIYCRRRKLSICVNCKLEFGDSNERGKIGSILTYESHFQLKNLLWVFGLLSCAIWTYYLWFYVNTDVNSRDWYVFMWLTIIAFVLDEVYFMFRYYNLYLDLKDNNEIISPDELRDMTAKTYLRYYVICGEYIYLDTEAIDIKSAHQTVIETPFFTKRSVNGITVPEVSNVIKRMTGVNDGHLRFFFGRKSGDMQRHSLLRYFYFLDGTPEDYPELNVNGKWVAFSELKKIYSFNPSRLSNICVSDITRLATIILTNKIFDERGFRKNKLKSYRPTFTLAEVRNSDLDFQDDKWIKISLFNSDTSMYRVKRWWRDLTGGKGNKKANQWS